ncbi:MAG TPA: L,D-transpeptidase [Gemmatimonadaceae bacterium]|nr:L,D-transpeptidase [Gemmatimonadaceae bacterium]
MGFSLCVLIALDVWLVRKRERYIEEDARLRDGMSGLQRQQADAILSNEQNKVRMMIELVRRQAQIDKQLHLAVPVDSGVMYLEQDGALLREMPVQIGPERRVGTPPDTVYMVAPRGTRTVERILDGSDAWEIPAWVYTDRGIAVPTDRALKGALGPAAIVLNGGTVIYSLPGVGPLNDSTYVLPGSIRTRLADIQAIAANLKAGMTVYFY